MLETGELSHAQRQIEPPYSPEAMDYAKRLTKVVRPGEFHGAQMAGTGASIAANLFPLAAALRWPPAAANQIPHQVHQGQAVQIFRQPRELAAAAFRSKPVATRADRPHHAAARASRRAAARMAKVR